MTECQGCGAWNDASRACCVLCDTPLAATDEWDAAADPPPLPPLPDGGLAAAMPAWLREPPAPAAVPTIAASTDPPVSPPQPQPPSLGARADPRTFLSDEDFPQWLRGLAAREATSRREAGGGRREGDGPGVAPPPIPEDASEPVWPSPSTISAPSPPATLAPPPPASRFPPPASGRHERGAWETVLLVLLFLGVVVAAVWALVSNGVLGGGV